jgi:hypothetical protein
MVLLVVNAKTTTARRSSSAGRWSARLVPDLTALEEQKLDAGVTNMRKFPYEAKSVS